MFYELLTGKRPFEGSDISEILASVIKDQPDANGIPREFRRLIAKCLEKDPARRLRDIGDVWELLDSAQPGAVSASPSRFGKWGLPLAVGALLLGAAASVGSWLHFGAADRSAVSARRMELTLEGAAGFAALSPDGQTIGYNTASGITLRRLDSLESRVLPGTERPARSWFWSPDGKSIPFTRAEGAYTVDVATGGASLLAKLDRTFGRGGSWGPNGLILLGSSQGIYKISLADKTPVLVTKTEPGVAEYLYPTLLPDGRYFPYLRFQPGSPDGPLLLASLDAPEAPAKVLLESVDNQRTRIAFQDGYVFYKRGQTLFAQPLDQGKLEVTGEAKALSVNSSGDFSVSGNLLVAAEVGGRHTPLTWFDRAGKRVTNFGDPAFQFSLAFSPDGNRVAVERGDAATDTVSISVIDIASNTTTKLPGIQGQIPVWSPTGDEIVFKERLGNRLFRAPANGATEPREFFKFSDILQSATPQSWFGNTLLIHSRGDIFTLNMDEPAPKAQPYLDLPGEQRNAQFSPDGNWVAYTSGDSGRPEVYVSAYPDPKISRVPVSNAGGARPRWSQDGKQLFYLAADDTLVSVAVATSPKFSVGERRTLGPVRTRPSSGLVGFTFDVHPDGRFLANTATDEDAGAPPLSVIVDWQALVR